MIIEIHGDRPDLGDIGRDICDEQPFEGHEQKVQQDTEVSQVPMEVLSDETIQLSLVEDLLVGRKEHLPGDDAKDRGHILETPAMIADDDVRTVFDEILRAADDDFFAEEGHLADEPDETVKPMELFLEGRHRWSVYLSQKRPKQSRGLFGNIKEGHDPDRRFLSNPGEASSFYESIFKIMNSFEHGGGGLNSMNSS
jgi:hypothetical protein